MSKDIVPKEFIDSKVLEYAKKGAEQAIREFYTGFDSPYKTELNNKLQSQKMGFNFEMPILIDRINEMIRLEIDKIANQTLINSLVPRVNKFFTKIDKHLKMSSILSEFVDYVKSNTIDIYEEAFDVSIVENDAYEWLEISISYEYGNDVFKYDFTLHKKRNSSVGDEDNQKCFYHLLTEPNKSYKSDFSIKLSKQAKIKLPYNSNVIEDDFFMMLYKAKIYDCDIEIDSRSFDYDEINNCKC